jgi:hypothetical protein
MLYGRVHQNDKFGYGRRAVDQELVGGKSALLASRGNRYSSEMGNHFT